MNAERDKDDMKITRTSTYTCIGMVTEGTVNTISLFPATVEFRPWQAGSVVPYVTTGIGVNVNTKDVDDTFAWRLGGGVDYPLTELIPSAPPGLMLNVETAWKRNQPGAELSSMGLLFGVRHTY